MELIGKNLKKIKDKLKKENKKLEEVKEILSVFIKNNFKNKKFEDIVIEFYLKGGILFIKTPRKIVAQELNYYKSQLLEKLSKITKEIRIF